VSATIWKYEIVAGIQDIEMPKGARVLCVQEQRFQPCIWVHVNPAQPMERRRFAVVGTGMAAPESGFNYIGTFQQAGGQLVWHVFERVESEAGDLAP
jgi:hypothetical protein